MPLSASLDVNELLTVTLSRGSSSAHVTAAGEVDAYTVPRLAAALDAAVIQAPHEVTVDLDGVTFFDSAGVHVLAAAYRRATAVGVQLRVVSSRRAVRRPLQLSGLWPMLTGDPSDCG